MLDYYFRFKKLHKNKPCNSLQKIKKIKGLLQNSSPKRPQTAIYFYADSEQIPKTQMEPATSRTDVSVQK